MEESKGGSGKVLDFFLPGMIHIGKEKGKYPAVSITGRVCKLGCLHCKGELLQEMIPCRTPQELLKILEKLEKQGMQGVLITGGCDRDGRLPWNRFLPAVKEFNGSLFLSAHAGLNVDKKIAIEMRETGISQVLVDVVGDEETLREVYKIKNPEVVKKSLYNLFNYGPEVIPHVIIGINKGRIKGEYKALDILSKYGPRLVILVVVMPLNPLFPPPPVNEVIDVFKKARSIFKKIGLGCARPRGIYRYILEEQLIEKGLVDRIAIWSDRAIEKAKKMGYKIKYHYTCCSVLKDEV